MPELATLWGLRYAHLVSTVAHMDSTTYAAAVAQTVERAIRQAGMTIAGVAAATGIPRTTLDRRLRSGGLSALSVSEVKAIADVLGVSAASLLTITVAAEVA